MGVRRDTAHGRELEILHQLLSSHSEDSSEIGDGNGSVESQPRNDRKEPLQSLTQWSRTGSSGRTARTRRDCRQCHRRALEIRQPSEKVVAQPFGPLDHGMGTESDQPAPETRRIVDAYRQSQPALADRFGFQYSMVEPRQSGIVVVDDDRGLEIVPRCVVHQTTNLFDALGRFEGREFRFMIE